jgi:hypothetical protein
MRFTKVRRGDEGPRMCRPCALDQIDGDTEIEITQQEPAGLLAAVGSDTVYAAANFTLPTNVDTLLLEGNASRGTGHDTFAFPNLMGHDEVTNFETPKDTPQFWRVFVRRQHDDAALISVNGSFSSLLTSGAMVSPSGRRLRALPCSCSVAP